MRDSVTSQTITAVGVLSMIVSTYLVLGRGLDSVDAALLVMAAYAFPIIALELIVLKSFKSETTGLDWSRRVEPNWPRVAVKLLGLLASVAFVVVVHWLLRLYPVESMQTVADTLVMIAPVLLPVSIAYVVVVDGVMKEPCDGYWHLGSIVLGRVNSASWSIIREHILGWVVKGFFLPIMFVYLVDTLRRLGVDGLRLDLGYIQAVRSITDVVVTMELTIVCVGYFFTLRALDSHIRSVNPILSAWLVTLVCYEPFNRVVIGQVLKYDDGLRWNDWFGVLPIVYIPWSIALIGTFLLWLWATSIYGIRWSNLTNRGIITNGPYRFTKHPDYLAKNIFFWLIHVPFLSASGLPEAIKNCLLLALVNAIYYGRAKMEERHLSADPAYVEYALRMNERSLFRPLSVFLPGLRYVHPTSVSG